MLACKEMVKIIPCSEAATKISEIPLSADIISCRVTDLSTVIEDITKNQHPSEVPTSDRGVHRY